MGWNGSNGNVATNGGAARKVPKRGMVSRRGLVLTGVLVALGALATWFVITGEASPDKQGRDASVERVAKGKGDKAKLKKNKRIRKSAKESVRDAMPKNLPKDKRQGRRPARNVELFDHLTGNDRKMAEAVQTALDNDDLEKTIAAATEALTSKNSEVRQNAVEALGWFGAQALPELTGAMADDDEDVRQSAENHFELAIQELEKSEDQLKVALAAFGTLSDEDQLTSLGGIVNNAATEFIDGEEDPQKQMENRVAVVQALVDIIEGENPAPQNVAAAKELYNDITCNEWLGIDEAERYLRDPENYDPDAAPTEEGQPAELSSVQSAEQSTERFAEQSAEQPAEQVVEEVPTKTKDDGGGETEAESEQDAQ